MRLTTRSATARLCALAVVTCAVIPAFAGGAMSSASARRLCLPQGTTVATLAASKRGHCLQDWKELASTGTVSLWHGRYAEKGDVDAVVSEVFFESSDRGKSVRPVWVRQYTSDTYQVQRVTLHKIGKWRVVEAFGCLQGTGGCGQDLILWRPGRGCMDLKDIRPKFDAALPAGYVTLKAPIAFLDRMVIEGNGWAPHDANGGPSLQMTCRLDFDGHAFSLRACVTRPVTQ